MDADPNVKMTTTTCMPETRSIDSQMLKIAMSKSILRKGLKVDAITIQCQPTGN